MIYNTKVFTSQKIKIKIYGLENTSLLRVDEEELDYLEAHPGRFPLRALLSSRPHGDHGHCKEPDYLVSVRADLQPPKVCPHGAHGQHAAHPPQQQRLWQLIKHDLLQLLQWGGTAAGLPGGPSFRVLRSVRKLLELHVR